MLIVDGELTSSPQTFQPPTNANINPHTIFGIVDNVHFFFLGSYDSS